MAIIRGTNGNDFLRGTNGSDEIDGEDGDDLIFGRRGNDTIRGGGGDDIIITGRGDNTVDGGTGDDIIIGDRGDDTIDGGDGDDTIIAGRGNDTVDGGDGNDTIVGDRGDDTLRGGAGDDIIDGGRGSDTMDGEDGSDTYQVGGRRDGFDNITDTGTGADDYDVIEATSDNTRIQMRDFDSSNGIEEISGNGFANVDIRGDNGDNNFDFSNTTLSGIREIDLRGGNDTVTGSAGDDNIDGGGGFDTVFYSGSIDDYDIQRSGSTTTVTGDGTDTLTRVEMLQFSDYTLFIDGRNNAPVAGDDAVSADEDTGATIAIADLIANDKDYDGDPLSFDSIDTSATLGSVTVNPDGTLSYDSNGAYESLAVGETATDSFTYTISDGQGGFATGTVTVSVNGANDGPSAADDVGAVDETGVYYVPANGVLANDSDPDASDTLSVGAVEGDAANVGQQITLDSGAILTMRADGSYEYDTNGAFDWLASGETAIDSFTYTVTDGHGAVAGAPAEPVQRTLIDENFDGGAGGFTYSDDTFRGTGEPAYADGASGAGFGEGGSGGLQVTLGGQDNADILGMSGGWSTTIDVPEDASGTLTFKYNLSLAENYEADEFAQVMLSVDGNPVGANGADHIAQLTGDGNGGPVMTTGWQTVTIDLGQLSAGSHTITIGGYSNKKTFNDESAEILIDDVQLTTDSTPMIETTLLDEGFDGGAGGFAYLDDAFRGTSEADYADGAWGAGFGETGGGLQITLGGQDGADILGMSGGWQTTINVPEDASGTLTFKYNMTLAPNFESDEFGQVMVSIDGTLYGAGGNDYVTQLNGDGNGGAPTTTGWQTFTVNLADLPAGDHTLVIGGYSNKKTFADESIEILIDDVQFTTTTPDPDTNGPETATVTVTVTGTNDDPVAADDSGSIDEDGVLSVAADGVLANDTDVNGDQLSVGAVEGDPLNVGNPVTLGTGAIVTMNADGSYTYDTNGAFESLMVGSSTTDSFQYTVDDGQGGFDTATVTITITGANDAPIAVDDTVTVDEGVMVSINGVLDNDIDPDPVDTMTVTEINGDSAGVGSQITLPSGALLTMNADGTYQYDPNGAFNSLGEGETGTDSFAYTVVDGNGATDTATVTVTINGANDAPTANDDTATVGEDDAPAVISNSVLTNDVDPDTNDVFNVTAVEGAAVDSGTGLVQVTLASGAIVTMNADGTYNYNTNGSFESLAVGETTTDSFSYTMSDGNGGTDTATVTLTIQGANDAPDAGDDAATVAENGALFVTSAGGLLANDVDIDSGSSFSITEVAGLVDVAIDPVNVTPVPLASGAVLAVGPDGSYTYLPFGAFDSLNAGETATDTFTYTITDEHGATDTATVTITITGVGAPPNQAPTALDDIGSVGEDGTLAVAANGVLSNDSDPDGDALNVSEVEGLSGNVGTQITLGSGALLTMNADGSYDYDPNGVFDALNDGETATDSFTYTVDDGNGGTDTATVTITVNGATDNSAPIANNDTLTVDEGVMVSVNGLLDNDVDPDPGDTLTVTHVNGDSGNVGAQITLPSGALLTMNNDGTYSYDPNGAFNSLALGETATDSFTYTATDSFGATDTATLTITINGANDAPVAADDAGAVAEDGTLAVAANGVLSNDSDPDASDVLNVSAVEGAAANVGAAVTLASGAIVTMNADGSYSYDTNGAFNGLGAGESTTDTFTYTVDDGNGGTDTATVTVTVNGANDGPTATDDSGSVGEEGVLSVAANGVLSNDNDPDGDALNVSAVEGAAANVGAAVTLASGAVVTMNADGSYSYDPNGQFDALNDGETATDTFTYTVSDGNGGTDTATVTVTINGATDNTAPIANNDTLTVDEGVAVSVNGVLDNDVDPDPGDTLTVTHVNGDSGNVGAQITLPSGALLTMNNDGTYSYDPNGAFNSLALGETTTDSFTYTATDSAGATDTATLTITINGANDAPVAADDAGAVAEDGTLVVAANGVLSNDSDPDATDVLNVSAVEGAAANVGAAVTLASGAIVTMNADGSYSYDTNGAFNGLGAGESTTDSFTYTVDDGNGGTDTATVTVTISGANDGPTAGDDAGSVGEDDVLTVAANGVLSNDSDPDATDVLNVSAVEGVAANVGAAVTLASGAIVTMNADGSYSYDTNGAFNGLAAGESTTDTFTYEVSDGNGGVDTATVTVTVNGANDAVSAADDTGAVGEDDVLTVAANGVLANDVDPDATDVLNVSAVEGVAANVGAAVTLASGAVVTMNADGSYSYDTNGAFNGLAAGESTTDTFTYEVSDGNGGVDTATVTVTINGANDGPTAGDDAGSVAEDGTLVVAANGVLSNDSDPDATDVLNVSAVEGAAANVGAAVTLASGAIVTMNADGSYSYDTNGAFNGLAAGESTTDTFTYEVSDGNGGVDTATVTVTINGANDGPTAGDDAGSVAEDDVLTVAANGVLSNDSDPDATDVLNVSAVQGSAANVGAAVTLASGAIVTMNADGSYSYDTNGAFNGLAAGESTTDTFTYEVSDGNGGVDTATVTVTINGANDGPTAGDDAGSVAEDGTLVVAANGVLSNDSDPDATDVLNVSAVQGFAANVGAAVTLASGAIVTMNADGSYSYDTNGAFNGLAAGESTTDTFTYEVSDGNGGVDTATVTVTVNGANDGPTAGDDAGSVAEDGTLVVAANGVLSNDSDPDATDVLNVSAVEGAAANVGAAVALASGAIVTMNADGSYSYDTNGAFNSLAAGESTTDTFTYEVSDGNGGVDTATVTVTVNGANDGPTAGADAGSVGEDDVLTVAANGVLANDVDPDATDVLNVSAVQGFAANVGAAVTLASGAIVTMNADGSYSYDTNGAFNGLAAGESTTDTFTYEVSDGNGGVDTATVTVTINGANDGPTAGDDAGSVGEDDILTVAANGVLSNDSDPDATDVLNVSAVEGAAANVGAAVALASGAIVTMNADGSYSYDTNGAFNGLAAGESTTDTFTYEVSDGNGGVDTATVTVTVNGANDGPTAGDDAGSVGEDDVLTVAANGVLSNDSDPDNGSVLSVSAVEGVAANVGAAVTLASGAIVTMNADGSYSYDTNGAFNSLAAGESTTDTFTYEVSDGNGGVDTATVTVTVNGANDGPTAGADAGSVGEDGILTVAANGVLANDVDPDATDVLNVSAVQGSAANVGAAVTLASGAIVTMNADGSYSYDTNGVFNSLATGQTATDTFTYTVDDGNGGTDTATVTVTINGANDGPTAGDDTGAVGEDGVLSVAANGVLANDGDPDTGSVLNVSAVEGVAANVGSATTLASGAVVTMNTDGSYSYDPSGAFNSLAVGETGTDTFTYTVSDGAGGTDTATVTITITGANDAPVANDDALSVSEDGALNVAANGILSNDTDPDASDVLSVSAVQGSAANVGAPLVLASGALLTMNADGSYSYDPNGQFNDLGVGQTATDTFTYTVDDGNGGTDTATVSVTINGANDGPTAADDAGITDENTVLTVPANGVLSNDSDPDVGDTFSVTAVQGSAAAVGGQIALASGALLTMNADGSYSYDPNGQYQSLLDGETATDSFTYTITDSQGATDTATVTVTINGISNSAPIAVDDAVATTEDDVLSVPANGVLANDTDPDAGDVLSVSAVEGSAGNVGSQITLASGALLTMNADGSYSYDPNGAFEQLGVGQTGTDTFTYTVDDGNGSTDTATVTVTVNGVNDAPVAVNDTFVVRHDDNTEVEQPTFLSNDFDPEGSALTLISIDGTPVDFSGGSMDVFLANGDIVSFNPDYSFFYVLNDPAAGDLQFGESFTTGPVEYVIEDAAGVQSTGSITYVVANSTFNVQDLDGTNGFVVNGVGSTDLAGFSVSGAGDVNGDGYDDFIVGAFQANPSTGVDAGASYVVFGGATGPVGGSLDLASLDGTNGFAINGTVANQFVGRSVSAAGDVNGDGFDDVLIGMRDESNGGVAGSESAYVVYGTDAGFAANVDLSSLDGSNGFSITGIDANFSDIVVSSAGDVNGDGIDDMVIGSQGAGTSSVGSSYVVFGQAGGFGSSLDVSTLNGTNGFSITGVDATDNLGFAVTAGDLNNDGYDDVIVGAVGADPGGLNNAGEIYVVYGGASGLPSNVDASTLNGTNGFVITGASADGVAGNSISSAGDINGDGIDDLVIGERGFYYDTGGAYVVFGQDGGLGTGVDLGALDGTNGFRIVGNEQGDQAGYSVAMAGDINGDGFDDIIIGARGVYGYDPYGYSYANFGESYVVFGSASGFAATLDLNQLDGQNGFVIGGAPGEDTLGNSVSSAGDVNGDGYDDLIIGAPKTDATGNDSGASYILYGQDFQGNVTHQGTSAADTLTGDAGANTMIGGQGADFLFGAGGADVLYGGEGDDTLAIADLAPQRIDGGTGTDTLEIQGASLAIDLGDLPISGIEAVDITGTGDNVLTLNVLDVLDASDSTNTLKVLGDLGDQVVAEGGWTSAGQQVDGGVTFDVYTAGEATLMVDSDLNNNVVIV